MTPGFILLAGLAVMVAVLFVIVPLVRSANPERARLERQLEALDELIDELKPHEYAERRKALRARLNTLSDKGGIGFGPVAALALAVPVSTLFLYNKVGEPEGVATDNAPVTELRTELIRLANSLEQNPNDAEQWARLGLAYKSIQEFSSAAHALRRSLYIDDGDPFVMVELAETLMFMRDHPSMPAESRQLLAEALRMDPQYQKALWLMGIGAAQDGLHDRTVVYWERLLPLLDPGSSVYDSVRGQIAQARIAQGQDPGDIPMPRTAPPLPGDQATLPPGHPPLDTPAPTTSPADVAPGFNVEVDIASNLAADLRGNETVFVIARAANGPAAPLAVRRITVADLPARIRLSDRDSMVEGLNLSSFPEIIVTARVSFNGGVEARPGDLQGQTEVVSVLKVAGARLTISDRL